MDQNNSFEDKSQQDVEGKTRRTFLTRAAAGVVITSIPGKSAWANIQGSIVASGQGSDPSNVTCLQVYSPGYWKNSGSSLVASVTFKSIFGGEPINPSNTATDKTLIQVISAPGNGPSGLGGPSNVNVFLVNTYLNALYDGRYGINFPASSGLSSPYSSALVMARALYVQATSNPTNVGQTLSSLVDVYHIDAIFDNTGNPAGLPVCN